MSVGEADPPGSHYALIILQQQLVTQKHYSNFSKIKKAIRRSFKGKKKTEKALATSKTEILLSNRLLATDSSVLLASTQIDSSSDVELLQLLAAKAIISLYESTSNDHARYRQLLMSSVLSVATSRDQSDRQLVTSVSMQLKIPSKYKNIPSKRGSRIRLIGDFGKERDSGIQIDVNYLQPTPPRSHSVLPLPLKPPGSSAQHCSSPPCYDGVCKSVLQCPENDVLSVASPTSGHNQNMSHEGSMIDLSIVIPEGSECEEDPYENIDELDAASEETESRHSVAILTATTPVEEVREKEPDDEETYVATRAVHVVESTLVQRIKKDRKFVRMEMRATEGMLHSELLNISIMYAPNTVITPRMSEIIVGVSDNAADVPVLQAGQRRISPVLVCMPHHASFSQPLSIRCPLLTTPQPDSAVIKVLYSDTDVTEAPRWQEAHDVEWFLYDDNVTLSINHFCLYCLVEENLSVCPEPRDKMVSVSLVEKQLAEELCVEISVQLSEPQDYTSTSTCRREIFHVLNKRPLTITLRAGTPQWTVHNGRGVQVLYESDFASTLLFPAKRVFNLRSKRSPLQTNDTLDFTIELQQCEGRGLVIDILESYTKLFKKRHIGDRAVHHNSTPVSTIQPAACGGPYHQSVIPCQMEPTIAHACTPRNAPMPNPLHPEQGTPHPNHAVAPMGSPGANSIAPRGTVSELVPPARDPEPALPRSAQPVLAVSASLPNHGEPHKVQQRATTLARSHSPDLPVSTNGPVAGKWDDDRQHEFQFVFSESDRNACGPLTNLAGTYERETPNNSESIPSGSDNVGPDTDGLDHTEPVHAASVPEASVSVQDDAVEEVVAATGCAKDLTAAKLPMAIPGPSRQGNSVANIQLVQNNYNYNFASTSAQLALGPADEWPISYEVCHKVGEHLDSDRQWMMLASKLKFDRAIDKVARWAMNNHGSSPTEKLLREWMLEEKSASTCYGRLLQALRDMGSNNIVGDLKDLED